MVIMLPGTVTLEHEQYPRSIHVAFENTHKQVHEVLGVYPHKNHVQLRQCIMCSGFIH